MNASIDPARMYEGDVKLPLLADSLMGSTNELPASEDLAAFADRTLIRLQISVAGDTSDDDDLPDDDWTPPPPSAVAVLAARTAESASQCYEAMAIYLADPDWKNRNVLYDLIDFHDKLSEAYADQRRTRLAQWKADSLDALRAVGVEIKTR